MNYILLIIAIVCSLFFSLSDIFQNKSTKYLGPFGSNIITKSFSVGLLFLIFLVLWIYKKPIGPLFIPKINREGIIFCIYDAIFYVLALLLLGILFYYNDKSSTPINLGILTAILSLSFIFTIIIDAIVDVIEKRPYKIKVPQIFGAIFIIIGITTISMNS